MLCSYAVVSCVLFSGQQGERARLRNEEHSCQLEMFLVSMLPNALKELCSSSLFTDMERHGDDYDVILNQTDPLHFSPSFISSFFFKNGADCALIWILTCPC